MVMKYDMNDQESCRKFGRITTWSTSETAIGSKYTSRLIWVKLSYFWLGLGRNSSRVRLKGEALLNMIFSILRG